MPQAIDLIRWNRMAISLGSVAWVCVALARLAGWVALSDLDLLLLLALCVIMPLAIPLVSHRTEDSLSHQLSRLVILAQPFAALCGGVSFLLERGTLAAALAGVWLLFTALVALMGVATLRRKDGISIADTCLAAALMYVPVGGAWLVLARWGLRPLAFSGTTVVLTAVHFHFISLVALITTGLVGQAIQARLGGVSSPTVYRVAAIGMLVNPLLVATGITLTQVSGVRFLESVAGVLLALNLMLIALLGLRLVVPTIMPLLARGLLGVSLSSVLITMLFAGAYAVGAATGVWTLTISQMIVIHGWLNALAFGFCGLLGWRLRASRVPDARKG
ncbi:MAG TPA: YndJ family protein [Ktedonobacterales bacterium]